MGSAAASRSPSRPPTREGSQSLPVSALQSPTTVTQPLPTLQERHVRATAATLTSGGGGGGDEQTSDFSLGSDYAIEDGRNLEGFMKRDRDKANDSQPAGAVPNAGGFDDAEEEEEDEFYDADPDDTGLQLPPVEVFGEQGAVLEELKAQIHRKEGEIMALRVEGCDAALEDAERELGDLRTHCNELERHLVLTQHYWEHQGSWQADLEQMDFIERHPNEPPEEVFVIIVHCSLNKEAPRRSAESRSARDGWLVIRTWPEVMSLHRDLRETGCAVPRSLKLPARPWRNTKAAREGYVERSKAVLQKYLNAVLADERAQESQCLFGFLCNSPDHLRLQHSSLEYRRRRAKAALRRLKRATMEPSRRKGTTSLVSADASSDSAGRLINEDRGKVPDVMREQEVSPTEDGDAHASGAVAADFRTASDAGSPEDLTHDVSMAGSMQESAIASAVESARNSADDSDSDEDEEDDNRDSAAKPLYDFVGELFGLQGVFQWLRRSLVGFVRLTYGKTINKTLSESVDWLFYDAQLILYISSLTESLFPLEAVPIEVRTREVREATRAEAQQRFLANLPPVLSSLVGQRNCRAGALRLFNSLQNAHTNRHLIICVLELLLIRLLPELSERDLYDSFVPMDSDKRHERAVEIAIALQVAQSEALRTAAEPGNSTAQG